MRRTKKTLVLLLSLGMVIALTTAIPAGATTEKTGKKEVVDSEFVFCTMDWSGEIEEVQVFEILSLKGDGTFDVREKKAFGENTGWQGVKGFKKPKVEGDYLVWEGLKSKDNASYIAATKLSEAMVEEARTRIPLDVRFKYKFDGVPVTDRDEITGKSGRFEMEVTFKNTSKEKTRVEYKDPDTGELKETEVETYLPLVIQPYDWYFDNRIFYNLEADPTGLVVPMPDFYNVGWSIPLFPPATEESHTIWIKADVKDFQLPPLTLAVAFVFPETNQVDPTALFKAGLEQLYGGVKQINEGVGDPSKEDTLLYGITAVDNGLKQMADAQEGLPYAKSNIDSAMIPGVEEAAAGIGSERTPQTLLYAANAVIGGLYGMLAGIGSKTEDETLLYAMNAMKEGLEGIYEGIGDTDTDETLLFGMRSLELGLDNPSGVPKPGIKQVAQLIFAAAEGITDPVLKATIQGYAEGIIKGVGDQYTKKTLIYGVHLVMAGLMAIQNGIKSSDPQAKTLMYAVDKVIDGLNAMKAGIGTEDDKNTLLYAMAAIQGGLHQLKAGMSTGDPNNPGLLEGLELLSAGLADAIAGLGSAGTPDTLLYGTNAIKEGLTQVGGGTQQMVDGLYKNLVMLNTTEAELKAIAKRAEEFDHLLGRAEDATNQVRFVYQAKPTYNYKAGSKASWIVAIVLSIIFALILVGGGIMLSRRAAA